MMMGTDEMFLLTATSRDTASAAKGIVEKRLYKTYQSSDYYMVMTSAEMMDAMNTMMNTMMIVLVAIAAISLLVGGIGIMNIMLVSVTERTREIGIRNLWAPSRGTSGASSSLKRAPPPPWAGCWVSYWFVAGQSRHHCGGGHYVQLHERHHLQRGADSFRHCCQLRRQRRHRRSVRLPARQQGAKLNPIDALRYD